MREPDGREQGDEVPYGELDWVDDLDFEAYDCVEMDVEEIILSDEEWQGLVEEW